MPAHVCGDVELPLLPSETGSDRVEEYHDDADRGERTDGPYEQRTLERQAIDVDAEVAIVVRVGFVKRQAASRERENRPVVLLQGQQDGEGRCEREHEAGEPAARHNLADLEVAEPARQHERDDGAADRMQIGERQNESGERGAAEQHGLVRELASVERQRAHRGIPGPVGVHAGHEASGQHEERNTGERDQRPAPPRHVSPPGRRRPVSRASLQRPRESRPGAAA